MDMAHRQYTASLSVYVSNLDQLHVVTIRDGVSTAINSNIPKEFITTAHVSVCAILVHAAH